MKISKEYIIAILLMVAVGCSDDKTGNISEHSEHKGKSQSKFYYTCSMHPQIREDKPGKCPICHMNLTKVEFEEDDETAPVSAISASTVWFCKDFPDVTSSIPDVCPMDGTQMIKKTLSYKAGKIIGKVKLRKAQMRHFNPDIYPVSPMMMSKQVIILGTVLQSEDREGRIPARIGGRIEKVYVNSTGELIRTGQPIVDIYSPELITGGEEYLIARRSYYKKGKSKELKDMLKRSEERLLLWGIKKFQIENWYKNDKVPKAITLYSPTSGIVRKRNAIVGKYFKEGQILFNLADLSSVWVELDVYEHDSALVKMGQDIELRFSAMPGKARYGKIDFISPVLDARTRTLKIRTTIENSNGLLKPGMVADAILKIYLEGHPLVVPRTAIIDTGKRKVVWVKVKDNLFLSKIVETGFESEGYVEVTKGLMENEEVVIEGNFLLDAQAQLFGGYEDHSKTSSGHQH